MEEYPDLDDDCLKKIAETVVADEAHRRTPHRMAKVAGWLFDQFTFNTHLFNDETISRMTAKGQDFYDECNRKYTAIDRAFVRALAENDETIHGEAKKASGRYEPTQFCAEVSRLNDFCQIYSTTAEKYCMQFDLRAGSGVALAAYFYRPVFRLGLFESLFRKH